MAAVGRLFLGSDAGAASIVAATFMAGLGFGSLYGAMFSKNLSQRKCITAGAGMLYSKEYFQAMKASLKPGGLLVTWLPTKRTYDTFRSVFPEHLNFGNTAFGSNQPIILDTAQVLERYQQFCLHARVKATGHDGAQLVSHFLSTVLPNDYSAVNPENSNRDLFPRDEFLLPQLKN